MLVLINDYVVNRRVKFTLDPEDFEIIDLVWDTPHQLLLDLQQNDFFRGRTTWAELDPFHFKAMLIKKLAHIADQETEVLDLESPPVKGLLFLLCGLTRSIEKRSESHLEMVRLVRVGPSDVSIEYQGVMSMEAPFKSKPKPEGLSIVIDNTDKPK